MAPCSIALLALGLCLGQAIHAQEGALPRPSISAEPGPVIPRGRPVTIVCRGPAGAQDFRLEKKGSPLYWDERNSSLSEREARFLFPSMSEDTAGRYHCRYLKSAWSEFSEDLRLVLSREDVTQAPTPVPAQPSAAPALLLTTEHLYILVGVLLALILCLLLLLLFCLHRQRQRKQGPPGGKGQMQRPQERLGLAVDSLERSPDMATADRLPEKDRETGNPAPAARDPQEVTYAQLDHGALTERAARAGSPLTTEPSTYATLARH
uniref:leukocyte-associated immunoglobulin-like receptor 1 n=1 Tax=Callospermophilus lateralis TaxID=76772 RepID=UPI0040385CDE